MDAVFQTSDGKEYVVPIEQQNTNLVRNEIIKMEHPHPSLVFGIVMIILIIIYYIYTIGIKLCIDGTWYNDDTKIKISHNKWDDTLTFSSDGDTATGKIVGNAVYLYPTDGGLLMGVYHRQKIYFVDSDVIWQRATHVA
jgi:hypothetical protein